MPNSSALKCLDSITLPAFSHGPRRLLLVMHGLGDSAEGYRFLPEFLKIPGLEYLVVNAPDSYFTGFSWFDLFGNKRAGITRSRELLFDAIGELEAQGWQTSQIGIFGFSQGCLMALDLACRYPKKFGCVVGVSGFMEFLDEYPEKLSPVAREQKIMVTHGTLDSMLPYHETRAQIQAMQGMGLSINWKEYSKDHTIDPRAEVGDIRKFILKNLYRDPEISK
ncbi:MAG: alpha/beta hydrolase [Bdellovibrionota bacterium]